MPIPLICPCSAKLRILDTLAGLDVQCPRCQEIHRVPGGTARNGTSPTSDLPSTEEILDASGFSNAECDVLDDQLKKGERLLWAAKPNTRIPMLVGLGFAIGGLIFALALGGIAVMVHLQGMGNVVLLVVMGGVGMIGLAAGMAFPFLNRLRYARTAYALTTQRALVWDCDWFARQRYNSYGPEDLASIRRLVFSQRADAVGHILFAREVVKRTKDYTVMRSHGFFYITGVTKVEKLIREHLMNPYTDRLLE